MTDKQALDKINLEQKLGLFHEHWTPKIIAQSNGQLVKLAKAKGTMVWHTHDNEDELFLVLRGTLTIELRDRTINLDAGELFVVPRGVEHRTQATEQAEFLMIEPESTAHTGNIQCEQTVELKDQEWI